MSHDNQQTPSPWHGHPTHAGTYQRVGSMFLVPDPHCKKAAQLELCLAAGRDFVLHHLFSLLMEISKVTHNVSPPQASTENLDHREPAHVDALYFCWEQWAGGAGATSPLLVWLATSWQAQAPVDAPPQLASMLILRPLGHQAKHVSMNQTICLLHPPKSRVTSPNIRADLVLSTQEGQNNSFFPLGFQTGPTTTAKSQVPPSHPRAG